MKEFIYTVDENINMMKGDTLSFGLEFDGLDQDLDTAYFTVKKNNTDSENLLQKSLDDGITKLDTNQYAVRVAPEDTEDAEPGKYYYDLQIGVNSDVFTILKGVLELEQDVTD